MNSKSSIFNSILDTIESEDIRKFAERCIQTIPDYFWDVGASSTGRYHPQYALGDLGLARHTCALVRFLNHIFAVKCFGENFTQREKDLMRVAGMMHDSRKSGSNEDFQKNKYTKFNHPLLAGDVIRNLRGHELADDEVEMIATTIESHMGEWNTDKRSSTVLPLPTNKFQKILHLADYLASRKDIEVLFNGYETSNTTPLLDTYILTFGKHSGEKLTDVVHTDPSYISWAKENITREPLRTLLTKI